MGVAPATRLRGVCPRCARTIAGRAHGPGARAADRGWVVLGVHDDQPERGRPCIARGEYVRVRRADTAGKGGDGRAGAV